MVTKSEIDLRRQINNFIHWNWTDRKKRFAGKEYFFVSVPKSGRTWLRYFLHLYFSRLYGSSQPLHYCDAYDDGRPAYYFTHDRYENLIYPSTRDLLRGCYLVPYRQRRYGRICLIVRQLPDLLVSLYFQYTKREILFSGDLASFIRHPLFGASNVVHVLNRWIAEWGDSPHFLLTAYEDWHRDTSGEFSRLLEWLTMAPPEPGLLEDAVAASAFENMRRVEVGGGEPIDALQPGSSDDPESFKTRRGKVGGYVDYLSAGDIAYIKRVSEQLHPRVQRLISI